MSDDSSNLTAGTLIAGSYRVLNFIGQGAMGAVYKVEHIHLNKIMALKLLRTSALTEMAWRRFQQEAKAIARLDNPHIVKIYDMNQTEDGLPFYTMDYLEGESLAELTDRVGPLPLGDAIPIFRQICDGLAYAHDRGIVHRDIKPGNIMLVANNALIVDFGIAKMADVNFGQQGLTRPGEVFGTPLYMSPEQCAGTALDRRSDIYSLGATFFQVLTGRPPVLGKSAVETMMLHQTAQAMLLNDTPIAKDNPFPDRLEEIIDVMLARNAEDRYQTLRQVSKDLQSIKITPQEKKLSLEVPGKDDTQDGFGETTDFGDTTGFGATTGFPQTQNSILGNPTFKIAAGVGIISALAISFVALNALMHPHTIRSKSQGEKDQSQLNDVIKNEDKRILTAVNASHLIEEQVMTPELHQQVKTFLASNPGRYRGQDNGKKMGFNFPENFSIGDFTDGSMKYPEPINAQGRCEIDPNIVQRYSAGITVATYPELLNYFDPEELFWIEISTDDKYNPKLSKILGRFIDLKTLVAPNCAFRNSDLANLESIKSLMALNIIGSHIDGIALSKSRILNDMRSLMTQHLKHVTPLLDALIKRHKINFLKLDYSDLSEGDYEKLAKLSSLSALQLRGTSITDKQLDKLTGLNVVSLNVDDCDKLTAKSLKILTKFQHLKELKYPKRLQPPESSAPGSEFDVKGIRL